MVMFHFRKTKKTKGLKPAHGVVPMGWLRPGVLIAHGGPGLLPCRGEGVISL